MSDPAGSDPAGGIELAVQLGELAAATADVVRDYLDAVGAAVSGDSPDTTLPLLMVAVSQVLASGAQLGALADVGADPDAGAGRGPASHDPAAPDPASPGPVLPGAADAAGDVRAELARVLRGLDEYADVTDPVTSREVVAGSLSADLADVAAALSRGLLRFEAGEELAALREWQLSYLGRGGERAVAALRVLRSVVAHLRCGALAEPGVPAG